MYQNAGVTVFLFIQFDSPRFSSFLEIILTIFRERKADDNQNGPQSLYLIKKSLLYGLSTTHYIECKY